MIRIRYPDFSAGSRDLAGLHGSAQHNGHGVTVYLLPGLTGQQRKAVIRRLRQEASRGFGPPLPLPALLIALGLDRVRTVAGTATAIVRLHPAVALLPGAVAAVMTLFVLASTGAAVGPAPRPGVDGVLVSSGRLASARNGEPDVISAAIARGGSELGSGVPASDWRARPGHQRRDHQHHHRRDRHRRDRHGQDRQHRNRQHRNRHGQDRRRQGLSAAVRIRA